MSATPRERLLAELETMTDEQIERLLQYVEIMESEDLSPDYDPERDPVVGFVSGPTDFGERAEEILWEGLGNSTEDDNPQ